VVIPLDNKNDLWKGGPWEQPSRPVTPIPAIHLSAERPVLRKRSRPRRWPWFLAGMFVTAALCLTLVLLGDRLRFPNPGDFSAPPSSGQGENNASHEEEAYSTVPPDIPPAPTGTGVTVEFGPALRRPLTYREIYQKNVDSIVSIQGANADGFSSGTGIILTADGYVITNAHVVADMKAVDVVLSNNSVHSACLVGFDAREDIAVLKIETEGLTPAEFGDSFLLQVGDPVAAIGDPLGYRSTITDGIISSLDRDVEVDGTTMVLIQTSAAINFGNSGGALINQYGQVVGITTVKIVTDDGSAEALGFAIPSRRVKYVADALIAGRAVKTGMFGFTVYTAPAEGGGLEVMSVEENSDAWTKGIRAGDILLSANGVDITSIQDLSRIKQSFGPGDTITIMYQRGTTAYIVDVALMDAEDFPP